MVALVSRTGGFDDFKFCETSVRNLAIPAPLPGNYRSSDTSSSMPFNVPFADDHDDLE